MDEYSLKRAHFATTTASRMRTVEGKARKRRTSRTDEEDGHDTAKDPPAHVPDEPARSRFAGRVPEARPVDQVR